MKTCHDCKQEKELKDFGTRKSRLGDRRPNSYCRSCMSKRARAWQLNNIERFKVYHQNYYKSKKV